VTRLTEGKERRGLCAIGAPMGDDAGGANPKSREDRADSPGIVAGTIRAFLPLIIKQ